MANSIELAKKYISMLDEVYKNASLTAKLDGAAELVQQVTGTARAMRYFKTAQQTISGSAAGTYWSNYPGVEYIGDAEKTSDGVRMLSAGRIKAVLNLSMSGTVGATGQILKNGQVLKDYTTANVKLQAVVAEGIDVVKGDIIRFKNTSPFTGVSWNATLAILEA